MAPVVNFILRLTFVVIVSQNVLGASLSNNDRSDVTDLGYVSRLLGDTDVANDFETLRNVYGRYVPGKHFFVFRKFNPDMSVQKRLNSDFGYGSRLKAAQDIANAWDKLRLYGELGPGKRSEMDETKSKLLAKLINSDLGYEPRFQAAENAAKYLLRGVMFGISDPVTRSSDVMDVGERPDTEFVKRIESDLGYGTRLQTGKNIAKATLNQRLYGAYGPGKRGHVYGMQYLPLTDHNLLNELMNIETDFGYGSRRHFAEHLADLSGKGDLFGLHGPGKRTV